MIEYYYVDALCINQSPNPTPAQMKEKTKQLDMMSSIYSCVTVTIIALTGKYVDAGLPGISTARLAQLKENINGCIVFTSPQHLTLEMQTATYSSRSSTLQEDLLSRRRLIFTQSVVVFNCSVGDVDEGMDITTLPREPFLQHPIQSTVHKIYSPHPARTTKAKQPIENADLEEQMSLFNKQLSSYTSHRMTNESDSLNAFRGVISALGRQLFPKGFVHGIPLSSHTFALGWMHSRDVSPRRRPQFPTWSWTGWEGKVMYPGKLLDTANALDENQVGVEGWSVIIDIRTEPFSELFVPRQNESLLPLKKETLGTTIPYRQVIATV
ncbi:hypothetical protein BKA67DRAFT_540441 [Truncatella angustata]|uniref:Heterokaryon incompatibility domain-containing protein n=1 Tax=Truncatella angustata TaxID=152316 RepID=A0A9P8RJ42_9PEZI|nr:uncharacterized protein BKA67DRAFT_540441 [Truncatella angustata]KAH6646973.1 hypothetical protein BKA67DRAFT_540441 [Truncatella angustata]